MLYIEKKRSLIDVGKGQGSDGIRGCGWDTRVREGGGY